VKARIAKALSPAGNTIPLPPAYGFRSNYFGCRGIPAVRSVDLLRLGLCKHFFRISTDTIVARIVRVLAT